jgi:pectin methylesterase-like acyl-CoA thioesterase
MFKTSALVISSICLISILGFSTQSNAANMTISNLSPASNSTEICADTKLWITFDSVPIVSTDPNKHIRIYKVSDNSIVYELKAKPLPKDSYGYPISTNWPYQITVGGTPLNYEPYSVNGNVLEIYPSVRLAYNTEYYVKITEGFCKNASNQNCPDINDNTTWRFTTKAAAPASDHEYLVIQDNSGDFCTMQGAIDAVTDNDSTRTIIKIKNGSYRGVFQLLSTKINVTFLGESKDNTILTAWNRESFNSGSDKRMLFRSRANGLQMYNLTLYNTAIKVGNNAQAETIKQSGLKCITENCNFKSQQDTLCINGQMYYKNCYIEGNTDYIWGTGTVYFDKCEMKSVTTGSVLTQPRSGGPAATGYFFVDCALTAASGVNNCYFGRLFDGYPYAQTALINCTMPSTLILPIGWDRNTQNDMNNVRLWEYKSITPEGALINTASRLSWSKQLTDADAIYWRDVNNVYQYSAWNPKAATEAPSAAWQPIPADGQTDISSGVLTWSAGAGASSHVVSFGTNNPPPYVAEVSTNTYTIDQTVYANTAYYWRVDEKNGAGTTTGTVWSFITSATLDSTPPSPDPMTWSVEPTAQGISAITMTASTATDDSGVEYFFKNVTDPNHNSDWQDSATYTDTGLDNNVSYSYQVRARDKSMNHNQTAYSVQAAAVTDRFACTTEITSDLNGDCQMNFTDFAIVADGWLDPRTNPEFAVNGTFDLDLSSWVLADAASATGAMTMAFDSINGLPAGSAVVTADTNLAGAVNNHRFYQIIPVTVGNNYKFTGKWKGSLSDGKAAVKRNWIEFFLGFSSDTTPSTWGSNYYKKRFVGVGNGSNINFSTTSDGNFDWEDLSASPNTSPIPPANAIWKATAPYMVISFNIGGNANGGAISMDLDNLSVVECSPTADLNGDCIIDFKDIAVIAEDWLTCNRNPADECWQ